MYSYALGYTDVRNSDNTNAYHYTRAEVQKDGVTKATSGNIEKANDLKNIYCFQIADTYMDDSMLDKLLEQGEPIDNLKKLNKDINETFEFIEITTQPLELVGTYYEGSNIFVVSPRSKKDLRNQLVNIGDKEVYVTPLKAIQLGQTAYKLVSDYLDMGRGFNNTDFSYSKGDNIPVILGSNYKQSYKLNDNIIVNYLERDVTLNIIGFFKSDLSLRINSNNYNLDTYICSPYFDIVDVIDDEDKVFQRRYYFQRNRGYIKINSELITDAYDEFNLGEINLESHTSKIQDIAEKNTLDYITIERITEMEILN